MQLLGWSQKTNYSFFKDHYAEMLDADGKMGFRIESEKNREATKRLDKRVFTVKVTKEIDGKKVEYRERFCAHPSYQQDCWMVHDEQTGTIPYEWLYPGEPVPPGRASSSRPDIAGECSNPGDDEGHTAETPAASCVESNGETVQVMLPFAQADWLDTFSGQQDSVSSDTAKNSCREERLMTDDNPLVDGLFSQGDWSAPPWDPSTAHDPNDQTNGDTDV